jgi:cardiolipin synthase A/B
MAQGFVKNTCLSHRKPVILWKPGDAALAKRGLLLLSLRLFISILASAALTAVSIGAAGAADATSPLEALLTQPDDGLALLKSQLKAATKTIDMTIYELLDVDIEQILADAASRKVMVRVLLDHNRAGKQNQPAFDFLRTHNVHVIWAPPEFAATHSKSITVDGIVAVVMTGNLDSQAYMTSRDFGVIDTDAGDIAAIGQVFDGDFKGQPIVPPIAPRLTWSPTQSEGAILNLINSAHATLTIENEEMAYGTIVDALVNAARRGVQVRVIMTLSKDWVESFDKLATAGVQIAVYDPDATLYIHAKVVLADCGTANQKLLIGSQNFSYDSLDKNRELGLNVTEPAILSSVAATLAKDFAGGRLWQTGPPKQ